MNSFLLSADTQIQIDKEEVNRYHAEFNTETTRKEESFFKACVATDIILLQFEFFLCGEAFFAEKRNKLFLRIEEDTKNLL